MVSEWLILSIDLWRVILWAQEEILAHAVILVYHGHLPQIKVGLVYRWCSPNSTGVGVKLEPVI